jgi:sucrose-6-phosphate hydrolase SacC (GH32 family)
MSNVKLDKPVTVFENLQNASVELSGSTKAEVEFKFTNELNDEVILTLNKEKMTLTRKEGLGIEKFSEKYAGTQVAPRKNKGESFDLKIYIDQSSIEIFTDGGKTVMTSLYFFDKPISKLTVSGSGGQIDKGTWGVMR